MAFISAYILHDFDRSLPPVVETDASDYAIAGILSVHTEDSQVHRSRPSVAPYLVPSSTTTLTTRSCSPPSKLSRPDNIISSLVTIYRCDHGPQESGVLLFDRDTYASSSSLVRVPLHFTWPFVLGRGHSVRADFYLKKGDRDYTPANLQNLRPSSRKNNSLLLSALLSCATS